MTDVSASEQDRIQLQVDVIANEVTVLPEAHDTEQAVATEGISVLTLEEF